MLGCVHVPHTKARKPVLEAYAGKQLWESIAVFLARSAPAYTRAFAFVTAGRSLIVGPINTA